MKLGDEANPMVAIPRWRSLSLDFRVGRCIAILSALQVPRLSPDMSVTFSLVPEIEPDPDEDIPKNDEKRQTTGYDDFSGLNTLVNH